MPSFEMTLTACMQRTRNSKNQESNEEKQPARQRTGTVCEQATRLFVQQLETTHIKFQLIHTTQSWRSHISSKEDIALGAMTQYSNELEPPIIDAKADKIVSFVSVHHRSHHCKGSPCCSASAAMECPVNDYCSACLNAAFRCSVETREELEEKKPSLDTGPAEGPIRPTEREV